MLADSLAPKPRRGGNSASPQGGAVPMQMLLNGQSELAFYRVTHFSDEVTALCDWQKHECDLRGHATPSSAVAVRLFLEFGRQFNAARPSLRTSPTISLSSLAS